MTNTGFSKAVAAAAVTLLSVASMSVAQAGTVRNPPPPNPTVPPIVVLVPVVVAPTSSSPPPPTFVDPTVACGSPSSVSRC